MCLVQLVTVSSLYSLFIYIATHRSSGENNQIATGKVLLYVDNEKQITIAPCCVL